MTHTTEQVLDHHPHLPGGPNDDGVEVTPSGYRYRMLNGIMMPPHVTPECYERSRRVSTRPKDICFTSYPKSGSTWLSYILVLLTGRKKDYLRDDIHWVESSRTYPRTDQELNNAPDCRIFKSHMPYSMALAGNPAENPCRYIYIARNPKDVCVSYYHFEMGKTWSGMWDGSWEEWLEMFLQGKVQRGDWFDHALSWWEHRDDPNVLFLRYEDLLNNTAREIGKIAQFLSLETDAAQIDDIVTKVGFREMQSSEYSSLSDIKQFTHFFRKGKAGSWKEQFTVQQSEAFDEYFRRRVGASGLKFDGN
ncbi:P-loop containing nucleoside triphosphate hydrolase protein [Aspergillus steynii IBT 23096]|uniref:P-loop containing nucleoside triphosphate hydrolase protein n=1 Tax=Aspergillus steynii IBT 23096 TaxID=1392250 RepID=A0A2I2GAR1_9EURO|nr:P-loop containing nucleoside triphosphate hydrolase protein [Aspergillus steynii IBT 23096]PLB49958.1 P-loop containing nucleoside triphosphate hydrolase protein [Aspergillus steynii IBT 23096]